MDGCRGGWTGEGVDGRVKGWMDGCRGGWTGVGVDGRV